MGIQFNCIINTFWVDWECPQSCTQPLCPLLRRCASLFTKNQTSHWKCVINEYSVCGFHSLFMFFSPNATPSLTVWYTADSMQSNAHLFMYINNNLHTERTDREKEQCKSNHNLLSLFFIKWLAWITVPLAPISFPRLQHTGSIAQLTKWPLNHVILLSVYHWQK